MVRRQTRNEIDCSGECSNSIIERDNRKEKLELRSNSSPSPLIATNNTRHRARNKVVRSSSVSDSEKNERNETEADRWGKYNTFFQTVIGSCSGAGPSSNYEQNNKDQSTMNSFFGRVGNDSPSHQNRLKNLPPVSSKKYNSVKINSSRKKMKDECDECHYAQFYEDEHARLAKAVLIAREREQFESHRRRLRLNELYQAAQSEAKLYEKTHQTVSPETLPLTHRIKKKLQVKGRHIIDGIRQTMATPGPSDTPEESSIVDSVLSDDEISALSANTLEEMTKVKTRKKSMALRRKQRQDLNDGMNDISRKNSESTSNYPPGTVNTVTSSTTSNSRASNSRASNSTSSSSMISNSSVAKSTRNKNVSETASAFDSLLELSETNENDEKGDSGGYQQVTDVWGGFNTCTTRQSAKISTEDILNNLEEENEI